MIIVGPCLKERTLFVDEGPFLRIDVEPVIEKGTTHGRQKHAVKVKLHFEQLKLAQLENRVSNGVSVWRRSNYSIALEEMKKLQRKHRQFKRQDSKLSEGAPQKPLKADIITITGDLADTLVLTSIKSREMIANIAALEVVGLSQVYISDVTDVVYNVGHKLAEFIRKERSNAPWLDGVDNVKQHFDDAAETVKPKKPGKQKASRINSAPRH